MIPYEGFVLGISTGTACLGTCGPVLIPFLMGEARTTLQNVWTTAVFLLGRLMAYLMVGMLSGIAGMTLMHQFLHKPVFIGSLFVLLGLNMLFYGFFRYKELCLGHSPRRVHHCIQTKGIRFLPFISGMLTGLNICPPFLLAVAAATETGRWTGGIVFFLFFFMGTLLFFVPLPFLGFFRKNQIVRLIGKFASLVAGFYYFYRGTILIVGYVTA